MLRALRVNLTQQMAHYRKPASFVLKESYPLPPYSTVIGMLHVACGWSTYHSMKVSIQGLTSGSVIDLATNYTFGTKFDPKDPTRHQAVVKIADGEYDGINIGPKSYELITDVDLVLHVVAEDADINYMFEKLKYPDRYIALGRHEDIVRIESVDIVNLDVFDDTQILVPALKMDAYIPKVHDEFSQGGGIRGTLYNLNKEYEIVKNRNGKTTRSWKAKITAHHAAARQVVPTCGAHFDSKYQDLVFLA